ncbi:ladderlectin-like [Poeciliopsis prolifica]|uniref:ladderlectin-like n=1 Tax=Poeciliopsis prolifica TaxID=188132 RepID=UPI00241458DC|nr:ladderlectin-like [Poeciliopsis prolifica]
MTIKAEEGFYKCVHPSKRESPKSWLAVKARVVQAETSPPPRPSASPPPGTGPGFIWKRVICGLLLFILYNFILILCIYTYRKWAREQVDLLQRSDACPSGWTPINSRCFQYVQKPMTWARAERNCLSMGGNLASVQDMNEYRQIQAIIATASYGAKTAWIGGSNAQEDNIWLWSDGNRFIYTDWCSGQPDNHGGNQH